MGEVPEREGHQPGLAEPPRQRHALLEQRPGGGEVAVEELQAAGPVERVRAGGGGGPLGPRQRRGQPELGV
jgi:hypothetical protein